MRTLVFGMLVLFVFAGSSCNRDGEQTGSAANQSQQNSGMGQMMKSPEMMSHMIDSMTSNPEMMRQMMDRMMSDPQMIEMMTRYMSEHADQMTAMMDRMMKNADHRRAMVEMMRRNPAMREQMRTIISEAERPAGSPTAR